MIDVQQVYKKYGSQLALNNLSFSIAKGEVVGFAGPNGAGKSTIMKILTGYLAPTSGTALVNGYDVMQHSLDARRHIGYLPEHNPLYTEMYVKEYLGHVASLYKLDKISTRVSQIVERVGLGKEQHKLIGALSKGYRQRVGIAQALMHDPEVLILDEPTTGLDPNQILEIRKLISELGTSKTILFSSHIMQEVEAICTRTMIIYEGKLLLDCPTNELPLHTGNEADFNIRIELDVMVEADFFLGIEGVISAKPEAAYTWVVAAQTDIRKAIFAHCVATGRVLMAMNLHKQTLEKVFYDFTMPQK
jgi:ABC-2 type transport system ATP-binding protein